MKKLICKVCKKEYYLSEKDAEKDAGFCSMLCESRQLAAACRNRCGGDGDRKQKGGAR